MLRHLERGQARGAMLAHDTLVESCPAAATTIALTASPHCSSGRPSTAASSTPGHDSSTASTSLGATFSPPLTIVSALRPVTCRKPRSSIFRGRRCAGDRPRPAHHARLLDPEQDLPVRGDPGARAEQRHACAVSSPAVAPRGGVLRDAREDSRVPTLASSAASGAVAACEQHSVSP